MDEALRPNEHIEHFGNRLNLIVSPEHTFGTDACLLAAFALPKKNEAVLDLGTGCGVIPFWWRSRGVERVTALEIQPAAVEMLQRSCRLSEERNVDVVLGDLRDARALFSAGRFDKVTMNPPYTKEGHGLQSAEDADRTARHETSATLPEVAAAASYLLRFGGSFCLCLRPQRLTDAFFALRNAGIEPKRLRLVAKNAESAPWLFLLEGKKGRAPGLTVEPTFCMYGPDGNLTEEARRISNQT